MYGIWSKGRFLVWDRFRNFLFAVEEVNSFSKSKTLLAKLEEIVKIGTEFTFSSDSTRNQKIETAQTWAKPLIENWKNYVTSNSHFKENLVVTQKNSGKCKVCCKFTYSLKVGVWWWVLDCDEGCIETQTCPSTLSRLCTDEVKQIIKEDIFKVAYLMTLEPDVTLRGGGGHLSFDVFDLFGECIFLKFLEFFHNNETSSKWDAFFGYPIEDYYNANWWSALECCEQRLTGTEFVNNLLKVCREKYLDSFLFFSSPPPFKSLAFVQTELKRLSIPTVKADNLPTNILSCVNQARLHYQAVNLSHVFKPQGRIEFRRISAQKNYEELIGQISFIFEKFECCYQSVLCDMQELYPALLTIEIT